MRRTISVLVFLFTVNLVSFGQIDDPLLKSCLSDAVSNGKYIKDFRIQLGKTDITGELRYKAQISLWKNTKYRFTLCNATDSQGQLIFNLSDDANKVIASSYDRKSGKALGFVDFICTKSAIYQLGYDFTEGKSGSGVGVISIIK